MDTDDPDSSAEGWIGRVIDGRYRITELIGEGGMGSVFAADQLKLERPVAIKIVRPEYAGNAELARRFAREAMVTSRIEHPNVISAIDYGTLEDGSAYLTMQLVRGKGLQEILEREGSLHWSRVVTIGAQIADALVAAAAEGIVHRDLKPENIMIRTRDDGTELVKVLDFGIAKFARESLAPPSMRGSHQLTQSGMVIGTPGYMAPEQAVGHRADHRSDLYSLGVMLWEALVGERMWGGSSPQEIIRGQLQGAPARPREACGDLTIPVGLDALVMQLCSDAPELRPVDATMVRDQLQQLALEGRGLIEGGRGSRPQGQPVGVATVPLRNLGSRGAPASRETQTPLTVESLAAQMRGPRRPVALGAAVLLATLAAIGVALQAPGAPPDGAAGTDAGGDDGSPGALAASPVQPAVRIGATGLPVALEPVLAALVQDETRGGRVEAARKLLGHIPVDHVPAYVRGVAHMQLAKTCRAKKQEGFSLLAKLRDRRALPALVLTSERSKSGCGPKGRRDCLD